jgi:glyoxylase-like metal-dependent hydrolase (beta-lactamase superfamily II)
MDRVSIRLKEEGPIIAIRMTRRILGIPLFKVYAFFIDGLLIDTGFANGRKKFIKFCDRLRPAIVVNTHHHEDHTGNNYWITKKYNFLPLAHPKTSSYMKDPSQWIPIYRRFTCGTPLPSETGKLGSEIRTPQFRFLVIPTPGHTDDHICLYEPNEGWLFSGDLFIGEQLGYSREGEDIYAVLNSLKSVVALNPKRMFCSFSGKVDHPEPAIHKKIEYLENLRDQVEKRFQQGLSPEEIRRKLLGRGDRFRFLTGGQISKQNLINAFLRNSPSPHEAVK